MKRRCATIAATVPTRPTVRPMAAFQTPMTNVVATAAFITLIIARDSTTRPRLYPKLRYVVATPPLLWPAPVSAIPSLSIVALIGATERVGLNFAVLALVTSCVLDLPHGSFVREF